MACSLPSAVAAPVAPGEAAHTVAEASVGYPFHVDRVDSIRITVDFGRSFTRVSKICLIARFGKDDPVSSNEEIFVNYPEDAANWDYHPHFLVWSNYPQHPTGDAKNGYYLQRANIYAWRVCTAVTDPDGMGPLTPERWLDGREVLYVEGSDLNNSDDGTATINKISAELFQ